MSDYVYDESSAIHADDAANRISEQGAYVGKFIRAEKIVSANTGTEGIELELSVPGNGEVTFSIYTRKEDGTPVFGANFLNAMMYLFGLKGLSGQPGEVERYDEAEKKRVKQEGTVYPDLCGKQIGVVFRKELYSKQNGGDGDRLSLEAVFQPETKLMVSELRERKTKPEKLDRLLKSLKVKDTRKKSSGEADAAQPSLGAEGGY